LILFAKANPGKIRYGSPGVGSNPHLIGEVFAHRLGLRMTHVPYKVGGAGIADVVSGQIEMLIPGSARTPLMPEVPALFGAIERLQRELPAVSQNPEYRKRIVDMGQEVTEPLQGEAFGQVIRAEAARWRELATMAGVKDE